MKKDISLKSSGKFIKNRGILKGTDTLKMNSEIGANIIAS